MLRRVRRRHVIRIFAALTASTTPAVAYRVRETVVAATLRRLVKRCVKVFTDALSALLARPTRAVHILVTVAVNLLGAGG